MAQARDIIKWNCDICNKPIANSAGYIQVSYQRMHEYTERVKEWEIHQQPEGPGLRLTKLSDLMSYPQPVRWEVLHTLCDPDLTEETESVYWFDVERARTHSQLLEWTAHLMGKNWLASTTWDQLIRRALAS